MTFWRTMRFMFLGIGVSLRGLLGLGWTIVSGLFLLLAVTVLILGAIVAGVTGLDIGSVFDPLLTGEPNY